MRYLAEDVAENIVKVKYEDLPSEVTEITKKGILDTLGVMFPPTTLEKACIALYEMVREEGVRGQSTLIGFGGKAPCWMAALVNGSLCHAMDYDDSVDIIVDSTTNFITHPTGSTFPAALAAAEKVGSISGKDFITAVALGSDLNIRLGCALKRKVLEDYSWFSVTTFGVFGATAAAGKVLGLTPEQMVSAFGMSLHRAFGMFEDITSPSSEIRSIRDGFTNEGGLLAALMAKKGIVGSKDSIEKLYRNLYGNDYAPETVTLNLGKEFTGVRDGFKPWPSCRGTHTYIEAALELVNQYNIEPHDLAEVICTVGNFGRDSLFTPIEEKRRPKLMIAAKLSLPFIMGVAFAKRKVLIEHFLPENLDDPTVLEIAGRVNYEFNPKFGTFAPAVVKVKTRNGKTLSKQVDIIRGHPQRPMSNEELLAKFKDCARYSKKTLSENKVDQLVEKLLELEKVKNIKEVVELLS